jgi:hypothetical protein
MMYRSGKARILAFYIGGALVVYCSLVVCAFGLSSGENIRAVTSSAPLTPVKSSASDVATPNILCQPGTRIYHAAPGDGITRILKRFSVPLGVFLRLNPTLTEGSRLALGQVVCLPNKQPSHPHSLSPSPSLSHSSNSPRPSASPAGQSFPSRTPSADSAKSSGWRNTTLYGLLGIACLIVGYLLGVFYAPGHRVVAVPVGSGRLRVIGEGMSSARNASPAPPSPEEQQPTEPANDHDRRQPQIPDAAVSDKSIADRIPPPSLYWARVAADDLTTSSPEGEPQPEVAMVNLLERLLIEPGEIRSAVTHTSLTPIGYIRINGYLIVRSSLVEPSRREPAGRPVKITIL